MTLKLSTFLNNALLLEITAEVNPVRVSVPDSRRFQLETGGRGGRQGCRVAGRVEGRPLGGGGGAVADSRRVAVAWGGVGPHLASSVSGGGAGRVGASGPRKAAEVGCRD